MVWQKRALAILILAVGSIAVHTDPVGGQVGNREVPRAAAEGKPPETNIIPRLTVSERYDSNVFFIQGGNLEDYVTRVAPELSVVHTGQLVEGTIGGGAVAEAYVKNPGLNYVAGNGMVDLNLTGVMNKMLRGLGLQISDSFRYTPQALAFAAPVGTSQLPQTVVQGIQAQRANSFSNFGKVIGSYNISPTVDFTSTFEDRRIRFGRALAPPGGGGAPAAAFIDTTFQTVSAGPALRVSPLDTLTLFYQYQKGKFNSGGSESGFTTQGGTAGWTRTITPTLTASLMGGVSVFSGTTDLQYIGAASLDWKLPDTDASLSYSRTIAPSFFVAGVPLLSQVWSASVSHRVLQPLTLAVVGYYAVNESVPDSSVLQYKSYSVTPSASYEINRVLTARLLYTYSTFEQIFSSQGSEFQRNIVMFQLVAEWK